MSHLCHALFQFYFFLYQVGLELVVIFLPQPPKYWNYRNEPLNQALFNPHKVNKVDAFLSFHK